MDSLNSVIQICGVAFLRSEGSLLPGLVDPAFPPLLTNSDRSHSWFGATFTVEIVKRNLPCIQ